MTTSTRLLSALAMVALFAAPLKAQARDSLHFLSKECNEDAIRLHVAPEPFQRIVGAEFSVALAEGKAQLLLLMQDCSQYWLDGKALGPTSEIHVWVAVAGLDDNRPVVGAQQTRPTMTWFSVFDGNSRRRVRGARLVAGSVLTPIDGVFLDPPRAERGGRASLARNLTYTWHVVSAPPPASLVGVNHDVYIRDSDGEVVLNRIQALVHVTGAASQGTLTVTGNTGLFPLLGAGTYPVSANTFFPVWVRGTLGISPPR